MTNGIWRKYQNLLCEQQRPPPSTFIERNDGKLKLILNADDFGYSSNVNHAIADSFEQHLCSNTTLMVNMPFADEAVELAYDKGFANKVGLHINLTEGKPLTDSIRRLKLFCDENGSFNGSFNDNTFSRLFLDLETIRIIRAEIDAQLERYTKYHLPLLHLDSHQYTHTNLPVFLAMKPLMKKYNIRSVRIARNINKKESIHNKVYKFLYNIYLSRYSPYVTNYFASMDEYLLLNNEIKDNENITLEIVLHPIYKDNAIWDGEIELIKKIGMINPKHQFISYADIIL